MREMPTVNIPASLPALPANRQAWMTKGRIIGIPKETMKKLIGRISHAAWRECAAESGKLRQKYGALRKKRKEIARAVMAQIVGQLVSGRAA